MSLNSKIETWSHALEFYQFYKRSRYKSFNEKSFPLCRLLVLSDVTQSKTKQTLSASKKFWLVPFVQFLHIASARAVRKIFPVFPGAHITNFTILIYLKFSSPKSSTTHSLFDFLFVISEPNKYKNSHCHWFWCLSTRRSQFIESLLWVSVELTHTFFGVRYHENNVRSETLCITICEISKSDSYLGIQICNGNWNIDSPYCGS